MKQLALLTAVYALIAALVLPSSLLAQEEAAPADPAPAEAAPAKPPAPPAAAPAAEPQPAAEEPAPAAEPPAAPPAPAAEPAPEPQFLADETAEKPKVVAAQSGGVTIVDFSFSPGTITINQGDTVTWTNNGPTPHSATSQNGAFDTGIFPAGQSRSHTFDEAGTFSYICTPHPNMHGTVVVRAAQTGGETPDDTSSGTGGTVGDATGEAAQADDGPTLPNTGADTAALLFLGWLLLVGGWAVQRKIRTG
jgi:plastocyanin